MMNNYVRSSITNLFIITLFLFLATQTAAQVNTSVKHLAWSYNQSIYEVNTRQYSKEGTFKAVEKDIQRIKEMGVGIIWLMPVHPIGIINRKGTLGSYYSVRDYLAVDSSYGTIADLKSLVKIVHSNGMYLIIDWVANHTSWDNKLTKEHPEYYTKDSLGNFVPPVPDWKDVIDLNYDNKGLRKYMINAMKFWIKECNIDGFRCDVADMVPTDFWVEARKELNKVKPVFMLAEAEKPELHEKCFDMTYSWELFNIIKKIAVGENNPAQLHACFDKEIKRFPEDAFRMRFTENHDENSWNGSAIEKLGNSAEMFAVFTSVIPGMPLVYNGQEACNSKRLDFFEKDPIQWKECYLKNIYTKILHLKKSNKALLNGNRGGKLIELQSDKGEAVYSFTRESGNDKVLAVFNMSNKPIEVHLSGKSLPENYNELFSGKGFKFQDTASMSLDAWGYKVFVK
jgi:cyclomaltodextrinase / maltogenic alpha-amylase / neopullulanase